MRPSPTRLARYRRLERRRGLPLGMKAAMAVLVATLGIGILWAASGAMGPFVSGVVRGFGGLVDSVGDVVASPDATEAPSIGDPPVVVAPDHPYTNEETVDVTVNVPPGIAGLPDHEVRLWVTLKDQPTQILQEVAVGPTSVLVIPGVELAKGRNDLQASIVGPGGETELSAVATWVLDQSRPSVRIISPKASSSTGKNAVTIKGKTQAGSTVRVRNDANGATVSAQVGSDGLFTLSVAVASGINSIAITATDPAGNPNTETISVRKGSGDLQVALTGSAYQFTAKKLPKTVSFTVVVTGPDGRPVSGATALFTVTVPGLQPFVPAEMTTDAKGSATFTLRVPKGAQTGTGLAQVLITTQAYGTQSDRQVLTVK